MSTAYLNGLELDFQKCNKIFVYGTLKSGYGNHYLLKNCKLISKNVFTCKKFLLYDIGYPLAVFHEMGYPIKGELYEMDSISTFMKLDELEGYPHYYKRKIIQVKYKKNGKFVYDKAWIYYVLEPRGDLMKVKTDQPFFYFQWG